MASNIVVKIDPRLLKLPQNIDAAAARILKRATIEVGQRVAVYPPPDSSNTPGPYPHRWYQRHFGPRWARKSGGYGGYNTSEVLQKSWKTTVSPKSGHIWTDVSYAPFVVGNKDQTRVMSQRGWKSIDVVTRDYINSRLSGIISNEIARVIGG